MLTTSRSVARNQKAKGAYGKVKLGIHKLTGQQVAIKKIDKQHAPLMAREIHHHRQLRHPSIVTLYEVISTESTIHLISEYCPNGELFDALTSSGRFSEYRAQKMFNQITSAVRACHQQGIVHRDLKLENILLDADNNAKLCDFGFARYAENNQFLETFCGSLAYSAPEVIMCQKYTGPATDVWSLGVILFTLLAGELPFDDDSEIIIQRKIRNVDYEIPSYFSPEAADLIQRLLQLDPLERPTIDQVANHPWLHMALDDDDHDNDSLSTRNSSHSDIDSIFSAPQRRNLDIYPLSHAEERIRQQTTRPFSSSGFTTTSATNNNNSTTIRPMSFGSSEAPLTRIEQQLVASLKAAGFDSDVVKSMRSGTCDTLGTVWQMLLHRIDSKTLEKRKTDEYTKQAEMAAVAMKVDATLSCRKPKYDNNDNHNNHNINTQQDEECNEKLSHTIPCLPASSIYGFGSERHSADKSGWFSSVRSWFAPKEHQQPSSPLYLKNQPSNNSSSSSSSSSYRDFDTAPSSYNPTSPVQPISSSPPIYRTGSQKQRRKMLQLSTPPVNELDQLVYSATSPVHVPQPLPLLQARTSYKNTGTNNNKMMMTSSQQQRGIGGGPTMPPAARTAGAVTDTLSIALISPPSSPEEHHHPPINHLSNNLGASVKSLNAPPLSSVSTPISLSHEEPVNARRFDFAPRTRLSAYGMSENDMRDRMSSKMIIEEEEEEEE
ncbi:kinase-like domain-containing protein [Phycomyces blakesleeanus]|uniref:Kinase-like domain-containing protein n=1 Tax=Phycomyces blakesleeanus TaxID=4837 RepID=A0ABR3BF14_PHYBL